MAKKKLDKLTLADAVTLDVEAAKAVEWMDQLEGDHQGVRFVDGHCTIDGDLELDWPNLGLVVSGTLTVTGSVINLDGDSGPPLIVGGDLKAKNIVAGGSEIIVLGSAKIANTVYGHYNHGELRIDGDLKAKAWINSDHAMWVSGTLHAPTAGLQSGDFLFAESPQAFHKGLIVDDCLDHQALLERILSGKAPISPKAIPPRIVVLAELEKLAKQGEVTALDLRGKGLTDYPSSIEALPLERLHLPNFSDMPDSIGSMQSLRELYLDGWAYAPICPGVYALEDLRVLHFGYTEQDASAPEGIAALSKLEVLGMPGHPVSVPTDLGRLQSLRELDLSGVSAMQMYAFPDEVHALSQLEVLLCGDQQFVSPPDLSALPNLHTLSMGNALGTLDRVPDLSVLKKLKRLNWSGDRPTTDAPYAPAEMLEAVRGLDQLEVLVLERWREEPSRYGAQREGFVFPDDLFAGLTSLRHVDLSVCDLNTIPTSLFELDHLQTLSLELDRELTESELARVRERWPDLLLDGVGPRFEVWNHEVKCLVYQAPEPSAQLQYRGLSIPDGARVEAWARGKAKGYGKYNPWIPLGAVDAPGNGAHPLHPGFQRVKSTEYFEIGLRLFPSPSGARPTVELLWIG